MSEPGFRFKEGKLYAFSEQSVMILEAWPNFKALRKEYDDPWEEFEPVFRVVRPYRPRRQKKSAQLELGLQSTPVKATISEQRRRAFDGFRFAMPKPVAAATEKFLCRQWGLLRLMQQEEAAVELAKNNPALCFALGNAGAFRKKVPSLKTIVSLVSKRQREIAEWLGFPGAESTVKILAKIAPESVSVEILAPLRGMLNDPTVLKTLAHQPMLNAGVLSLLIVEELRDAVSMGLLSEIAAIPAEKYRASYVDLLADTLAMLQQVKPNVGRPKIQSLARLRTMHDEVSTEFLRNLPPESRHQRLPTPPLRGTKSIVPICTFEELVEEGRTQENCVATYVERICKRSTFIYRVTHPERATLSIVRGHDGDWRIGELECHKNTQVSAITRKAVESWLDQYAFSA